MISPAIKESVSKQPCCQSSDGDQVVRTNVVVDAGAKHTLRITIYIIKCDIKFSFLAAIDCQFLLQPSAAHCQLAGLWQTSVVDAGDIRRVRPCLFYT